MKCTISERFSASLSPTLAPQDQGATIHGLLTLFLKAGNTVYAVNTLTLVRHIQDFEEGPTSTSGPHIYRELIYYFPVFLDHKHQLEIPCSTHNIESHSHIEICTGGLKLP